MLETCPNCGGSKIEPQLFVQPIKCHQCNGTGHVFEVGSRRYYGPIISIPPSIAVIGGIIFLAAFAVNYFPSSWLVFALTLLAGLFLALSLLFRSFTILIIACIFAAYPAYSFRGPLSNLGTSGLEQVTKTIAARDKTRVDLSRSENSISPNPKSSIFAQRKATAKERSENVRPSFEWNNSLIAACGALVIVLLIALTKFPVTFILFGIISVLVYMFGGTQWLTVGQPIEKAKQLIWTDRDVKTETSVYKDKDMVTDFSHLGTGDNKNKSGQLSKAISKSFMHDN